MSTLASVILYGVAASRPSAGIAGRLFFASDTGAASRDNGVTWDTVSGAGSGTVTSVDLTMPAEFSVSGNPITTSGTLAVAKANQSANLVYAGPSSGGAAAPTFRAVAAADLPLGSSSAFGAVKVDGTTITASAGVISAVGGGSAGALVLLEQHTASSSASLDFTSSITSTYDEYMVEFISVLPATNGTNLLMRFSTNGGSSYDSAPNYRWVGFRSSNAGSAAAGSEAATSFNLTSNGGPVNGASSGGVVGSLKIYNPLTTTQSKLYQGDVGMNDGTGSSNVRAMISGTYASNTAVDAFQFLMASGNIAAGTIRVYGIAK